ncbi:hypothetical protein BSL82_11875 [Tardibacter chloracetimidivorans]|uniref:Enoyl-CoA hydratase n=1 Tax=Tardibacter chloracetimidivorans TaxID=1921510 RepID=A0A1L3ZWB2_9SPHN|nr:enoyl-CoA hydratase-related protein [Tardibacter chloracetimidivorans]API59922.1 hypothetical protein BSL82_11875 [Tardibacter chloracetimidivorans]
MTGQITIASEGRVRVLTLDNQAARNALSSSMLGELIEALEAATADGDCRAVVLTGAGGTFCAGGDLSAMRTERPLLGSRRRIERAHRLVRLLVGGPRPVAVAVEGIAAGLGLSLACGADYLVGTDDARYVASFAKVGLIPDMGLLWSLSNRIGVHRAHEILLTARMVDAAEAERVGLTDRTVARGAALTAALEWASQFADRAPIPVALTRSALAKGVSTLEDALRFEVDHQPALYLSADHKAAVDAFFDKRTPSFRGE